MLGYASGAFSLLSLLDRVEWTSERELDLRMKGLELGEMRFLSGVVKFRMEPGGGGNGRR